MSYSPVPRYAFSEITDISPAFLQKLGLKLLMLDLDNTIGAYSEHSPPDAVSAWAEEIKSYGIRLYIVTNSTRKKRVEAYAKSLGIEVMMGASKPSPTCIAKVLQQAGCTADESALAGDQVFTDILAANRAGIVSIAVQPRRFTNPFLALRYALEIPFRAMSKNKMWKTK